MTVLAWFAPALWLSPQASTATGPVLDSTRQALSEYARRADALGVSGVVLVADGDKVLVHAAMGWRDPERRAANETAGMFYIASLSKQFVAAAILLLESEGRLRTSDTLGRFFAAVPPDKQAITIDMLMHHRSGLPRYGFDLERRDWAVETREQSVRGILSSSLLRQPASGFDYQNSNYVLLTAIVEQVSGMPIESFLERRLFQPAGMRDTYAGARITEALRKRVVWSLGDPTEAFTILDRRPSYLSLGRGVVTNAADLHRWMRALSTGRILPPPALRKLFSIGSEIAPGYGYGGGWYVRTDSTGAPRIVFHRGDFGGYRSEVRLSLPSGRISIALLNESYRGESLTETLLNDLSGIAFRGDTIPLPKVSAADPNLVGRMAGEYWAETEEMLDVRAVRGRLMVSPVGQRAVDWLVRGDTVGWEARQRVMDASMAAIDRLKLSQDPRSSAGTRLPSHQLTALSEEWSRLSRRGGRLKSYQRLGAVEDERAGATVAIMRLVFAKDSLLFGMAWANDTVAYTAAGISSPLSSSAFARLPADTWAHYDWIVGREVGLRFATATDSGPGEAAILETSTGPVRFLRQKVSSGLPRRP